MSRARPFYWSDGRIEWFNRSNDGQRATSTQLELLADTLGIEIDDLLDQDLTQRQIADQLHEANGNLVPVEVLEARRARKVAQSTAIKCRICSLNGWECDGSITRHHFVPRWLMRELDSYGKYAARSKCCIPVCVGRHRDLHFRGEGASTEKSIIPYLTDAEKALAQEMLDALHEQRPAIFELMLGGSETSYEYHLVRDYMLGRFREPAKNAVVEATEVEASVALAAHSA